MNKSYALVFLRAVDIFFCTLIWRDYDATISAMCGLELRKPAPRLWAKVLGAALNWVQKDHCEKAIAADLVRALTTVKMLEGM